MKKFQLVELIATHFTQNSEIWWITSHEEIDKWLTAIVNQTSQHAKITSDGATTYTQGLGKQAPEVFNLLVRHLCENGFEPFSVACRGAFNFVHAFRREVSE